MTLFTTPVIYIYLDRLRRRVERVRAPIPTLAVRNERPAAE